MRSAWVRVGFVAVMAGVLFLASAAALAQDDAAEADAGPAVTPFQMVEVRGGGPIPMILIPDIGFDVSVWTAFMERNAGRYTMYAVTLPGSGPTSAPPLPEGATWEDLRLTRNAVAAVDHLIRSRRIERPVVVGHGYGGLVAMSAAVEFPDRVRAVVSINGLPVQPMADPSRDPDFNERKEIIVRSVAPDIRKLTDEEWRSRQFVNALELVTDQFRARDLAAMFLRTDRGVATFYFLESLLVDVRPGLKTLAVPMLCIAPISPNPSTPHALTRMIWLNNLGAPPNTTLTFYPDCRHFVMDDNPAQLDHDIAMFLAGEPVPGGLRTIEPVPPEDRPYTVPKTTK